MVKKRLPHSLGLTREELLSSKHWCLQSWTLFSQSSILGKLETGIRFEYKCHKEQYRTHSR